MSAFINTGERATGNAALVCAEFGRIPFLRTSIEQSAKLKTGSRSRSANVFLWAPWMKKLLLRLVCHTTYRILNKIVFYARLYMHCVQVGVPLNMFLVFLLFFSRSPSTLAACSQSVDSLSNSLELLSVTTEQVEVRFCRIR